MDESDRLRQILERDWKASLEEEPELATQAGTIEHDHRWTDWSMEAVERRKSRKRDALRSLGTIDRAALTQRERVSLDLYARLLAQAVEAQQFPDELLPVDNLRNIAETVPRIIGLMPASSAEQGERILARLQAVPALVEQTIELLELGIERGVTQPRTAVQRVPGQLEGHIESSLSESPLLAPFRNLPEKLRQKAEAAVVDCVRPSFERLRRFLVKRYLPRARKATDWTSLPDGEAWYAFKVREATTTRLSPGELHELGLGEVARVRAQMSSATRDAGFADDLDGYRHFLLSDPRFFYPDAESLLAAYRDICKRIEPELMKLFGRLPSLPFGVAPAPEHLRNAAVVGYYQTGSLEGRRPGWFHVNTYDVKARPKWEMEVLTLHEAVPGHHFQLSLTLEQPGLPEFRKWACLDAYSEGWALYAESLGVELGLYTDPHSRMGRLSYDALRCCRLVVDPGLHQLGWSRQKAIDYLLANSCEARHDVEIEIDRYIAWPGQALSYKAGELAIRRLRERAAARLGQAFDVSAFHDQLLAEGPLPLDMLEQLIEG